MLEVESAKDSVVLRKPCPSKSKILSALSKCSLIMDEFYGGYNYTSNCDGSVV